MWTEIQAPHTDRDGLILIYDYYEKINELIVIDVTVINRHTVGIYPEDSESDTQPKEI